MSKFTITMEIFAEDFNIAHRLCRLIVDNAHKVHDAYADELDDYNQGPPRVTMLSNYEWNPRHYWHKPGRLAVAFHKFKEFFTI